MCTKDHAPALLSVVIPALNEEASLGDVIERTLSVKRTLQTATTSAVSDLELIVVDDGSTDRTADVARRFADVVFIRHETTKGYGRTLKTGFEAARGEYVGFLDADGTYPPEQLPRLCEELERDRADIAIGSRMAHANSAMPVTRYVGNWLFARLLSWIAGRRVTDAASGMRVFRRSVLPRLLPLPDGLHLTPAMSAKALHEGLRIVEVPIAYDERVGRSKLNVVLDGVRFLNIIVKISQLYNPWKLFGLLGSAFIASGLWLSVKPVAYYLQVRRVEDVEIYRLFAITVLCVTGISLLSFGVFASHIVEVIRGRPLPRGLLGRWLLRPRTLQGVGWLGLMLMVAAPLLNHQAILQYVGMGRIYVHWVYMLTGTFLFLVGLQLVMGSALVGIVQELKAADLLRAERPTFRSLHA